jgi:hypothetical protein
MTSTAQFKVRTRYIEKPNSTRNYGMDTVNNFIHALEARRETEFDDLVTQTFICLMVATDLLIDSHRKLRTRVDELEGNTSGHAGPRIGG